MKTKSILVVVLFFAGLSSFAQLVKKQLKNLINKKGIVYEYDTVAFIF